MDSGGTTTCCTGVLCVQTREDKTEREQSRAGRARAEASLLRPPQPPGAAREARPDSPLAGRARDSAGGAGELGKVKGRVFTREAGREHQWFYAES